MPASSPNHVEPQPAEATAGSAPVRHQRWWMLLLTLLCIGFVFGFYRNAMLDILVDAETHLRRVQTDAPVVAALIGLLIYTLVAGLTPGAAILSLAYGWYFGLWQGTLLVSFGSTAGATMMFLLSRYILRDWVQTSTHGQVLKVREAFERDGAYYLFSLRLIPAVPFFLVNLLMGLTKIRVSTFWWVSQLGMLPGTIAYIYAGTTLPSLRALRAGELGQVLSWQLVLAFMLLGLLPWAMKSLAQLAGRSRI